MAEGGFGLGVVYSAGEGEDCGCFARSWRAVEEEVGEFLYGR